MTGTDSPPPFHVTDQQRAHFQKLLVDGVRKGLDAASPGSLLSTASILLSISAGGSDPATTTTLIRSLAAWEMPESSAAALTMATLIGDAELRRELRRDIADRGHHLPRWLVKLHRAEPADRAVQLSDPFRTVDELLIGITVPGEHPLCAVVRVDNEFGSGAAGVTVLAERLDTVLHRIGDDGNPDAVIRDIDPADARARLTEALSKPDLESLLGRDVPWHQLRPLVTWMLSFLPEGGDPLVPGRWDDADLDDVVAGFLASPWGRPWARGSLPLLVEEVIGDGLSNGLGDPLLWAPHHITRALDPEHPFLCEDELDAERIPELLRDVIRYGHAERGLRLALTDESLAAVDRCTDVFTAAVRSPED